MLRPFRAPLIAGLAVSRASKKLDLPPVSTTLLPFTFETSGGLLQSTTRGS